MPVSFQESSELISPTKPRDSDVLEHDRQEKPCPPVGPTKKEVDKVYELLSVLQAGLEELNVKSLVVSGSLLGAVRSQSILPEDRSIALAIVDDGDSYHRLKANLPAYLEKVSETKSVQYTYEERLSMACDRVRCSAAPRLSVDIFVLRRYESFDTLAQIHEKTEIGQHTPPEGMDACYISMKDASYPLYHFDNRQAIDLWSSEYFTPEELFPLRRLKFGPCWVQGPNECISTLKRVFGSNCLTQASVNQPFGADDSTGVGASQNLQSIQRQILPGQHLQRDQRALSLKKQKDQVFSTAVPKSKDLRGLSRAKSLFTLTDGNLLNNEKSEFLKSSKSFGADIRPYITNGSEAPTFGNNLRSVMESYVRKARLQRDDSRDESYLEVDASIASSVGVPYTCLREERCFLFDEYAYPLHQILADTLGVDDLSKLHEHAVKDKQGLLSPLLRQSTRLPFHKCYDNFVTSFCIPLLHSLAIAKNLFHTESPKAASRVTYRYQAFPCLQIVRPGESSIGPCCDIASGHSIGSLLFHVPLTAAFGTNALYTESHPGREDWHPLNTKSVGLGYLFDGARCLHFTMENATPVTRVSIDFRILIYREGHSPKSNVSGGLCTKEMLADRYSSGPGYYDEATVEIGAKREAAFASYTVAHKKFPDLFEPDRRVGVPFAN